MVCIASVVCLPSAVFSQVMDDFSDGNFTQNPSWSGDTARFEVNTAGQLHLKSEGSDTSLLVTPVFSFPAAEWRFWGKLSFNTSANNFARVYLAADTSDILLSQTGFYLQAGGSNDSLVICRLQGGVSHVLYRFSGYRTNHSTNAFRIRIVRESSGWWTAQIDTTGGEGYFTDGTFFDGSIVPIRWFGLMCRYTSSNATKFYFDDFYAGSQIIDSVPPTILQCGPAGPTRVRISFSEAVNGSRAADPENYTLTGKGAHPDSVANDLLHPWTYTLFLRDSLEPGNNEILQIRNISDLSGNIMTDTTIAVYYYENHAFDVVIDEILADPDPVVGLPEGEFAELYNRSGHSIDLEGWTFTAGSSTKTIPAMVLGAGEFVILCRDTAYLSFGRCAQLFTSAYTLPNEGTTLTLRDAANHVVHSVTYDMTWFRGMFKEDGGWSLEMVDPANPCGCGDNWVPSEDPSGGTPGRRNSVNTSRPDETVPYLAGAWISGPGAVRVTFSEAMDSATLMHPSAWTVNVADSLCHPLRVIPEAPEFHVAGLHFSFPFLAGNIYSLRVNRSIRDCAGQSCDSTQIIRFALPEPVSARDLVINEILPDPEPGGMRFLEIYNRSGKVADLQTVVMSGEESKGYPVEPRQVVSSGKLLFPGEYATITPDPTDVCQRYFRSIPATMLKMEDFPTLDSDSGTVFLARYDNLAVIDRVKYRKSMHYPLLVTTEGVSLERTDPEIPSDNEGNWHSAAETAGFATPGCLNSHWSAVSGEEGRMQLEPAIFSPDNDGRDDLLKIILREMNTDQAVRIAVYDAAGRMIRVIADHVLAETDMTFLWDGMTDERTLVPPGFYIIYVEITDPGGSISRIRRTAVVAAG
ncbi:MAG TPA: lamin tail domain-containing protein [Bacteroidales bacterium]|nr:lamin tail domain-containing protein [Bacteroidales bacterium]